MSDSETIRQVLENTKIIALVGASPKPHRASYQVMQYLMHQGYDVYPVNPLKAGDTILGRSVVSTLDEVPVAIDMVDVFRNSVDAGDVVDDAIRVGAKSVWLQLGVINEPAEERAIEAGLAIVMDHCPAIEIPKLGIAPVA